jgi:hypothetical protein
MPSLGDFGVDLIGALGGKPTKQAQRLFSSWQRWEGGHTANAATWNPLNLTAPGSGLPTINSVGVVAMPSRQAGVKRTAELLRSGYPAIARAMASGQVDFQDPELQGDLNRWLSGKRTPGMTPYVQKIAGSYGQDLPLSTPTSGPRRALAASPSAVPAAPQRPVFDPGSYASTVLGQYASGGSMDFTQLPGVVQSSFRLPPPPPAAPGASPSPGARQAPGAAPHDHPHGQPLKYEGKTMVLPTKWKSTHPTSGLEDSGFNHAIDIMGSPGTPVAAPVSGTIIRHGSAQGGSSIYFQGDDGRTYWIGHIESDVPAGTKVKRGQVIAQISADHAAPHVHLDYSTSYR